MKKIPSLTRVLTAEQDQTESSNNCPVAGAQEDGLKYLNTHRKRFHAPKTGHFHELDIFSHILYVTENLNEHYSAHYGPFYLS